MIRHLIEALSRTGILKTDLDHYLIRAAMVIVFLTFGYQKWFLYEAQVLIPYIGKGPLISWLYPAFGIRGASWFLGGMEWMFGLLLFLGYWSRPVGILGALGSCGTFISTVTIIPFMPNGWDVTAGGFPAMSGNVPFLVKDIVLLAASFDLLRQDVFGGRRAPRRIRRALALPGRWRCGDDGRLGLLSDGLGYNLLRASMVLIFFWYGYTKWHQYGAQAMVPFISHSPFIFWLYPVFGFRGAAQFLGTSEWTIFALLYAGFWDKRLGALGALGAAFTFVTTVTIIPFMPNGWDPAAGFPAMAGEVPFLMKDVVLLAVSIYLLKQDLVRLSILDADDEIDLARGSRRRSPVLGARA